MIPVHHIAATQMFFLKEGMLDAARREGTPNNNTFAPLYKRITGETQGGIVDFVVGMSPIIDTLTACVLVALESNCIDFPGVFEYEVTTTVGDILYTDNYHKPEKLSEDYKAICYAIMTRAHEFFTQGGANELSWPTFHNAAIIIESALADGTYSFKPAR